MIIATGQPCLNQYCSVDMQIVSNSSALSTAASGVRALWHIVINSEDGFSYLLPFSTQYFGFAPATLPVTSLS